MGEVCFLGLGANPPVPFTLSPSSLYPLPFLAPLYLALELGPLPSPPICPFLQSFLPSPPLEVAARGSNFVQFKQY